MKITALAFGIYRSVAIVALFLMASGKLLAASAEGVVAETGLRYWEWQDEHVLFRLTQRLPDQTRAFFLARGFNADDADFIARQCVFQSMFRNNSPQDGDITIDLQDWRVITEQGESRLLTRETWQQQKQLRDAPSAAKIALEWSLLPTRQSYQANDYNWGMSSYGLPPGGIFDLEFSWVHEGRRVLHRLKEVECPADIDPDSGRPE